MGSIGVAIVVSGLGSVAGGACRGGGGVVRLEGEAVDFVDEGVGAGEREAVEEVFCVVLVDGVAVCGGISWSRRLREL